MRETKQDTVCLQSARAKVVLQQLGERQKDMQSEVRQVERIVLAKPQLPYWPYLF